MNNTTPNPYSAGDPKFGCGYDWYQRRQVIGEPDTVMSDFEDSTVTYTTVSSPFMNLPNIRSLGVNGPPVMQRTHMTMCSCTTEDGAYFRLRTQPTTLLAISPTANSPGYVPESDPKEDDDEDPEEDPADYLVDGGDDGDDEDESSNDDEDEDVDIEGDEEEEEHPAPADSTAVALPAIDQAPSAEETEPFEIDESAATPPPHPAYRVTARISIRDETPITLPPKEEIPSPPLPLSSPVHVLSPSPPASPIRPLGYQATMIRVRAEAVSTSHSLPLPPPIILSHTRSDAPSLGTPPLLPISVPTSSPPLHLLSTDRRADRPKVTLPPRKRLGIALGPSYEVGESSFAAATRPTGGLRADYGFVATIDREIMRDLERDVVAHQAVITELQAADCMRQAEITGMLAADRRRQEQFIEALRLLKRLQTQMTEFERQQGPAKGLAQPDAPEEAGSSS
ncbi:hypothetical protein Tco_0118033 [Tanacetum coccineum]